MLPSSKFKFETQCLGIPLTQSEVPKFNPACSISCNMRYWPVASTPYKSDGKPLIPTSASITDAFWHRKNWVMRWHYSQNSFLQKPGAAPCAIHDLADACYCSPIISQPRKTAFFHLIKNSCLTSTTRVILLRLSLPIALKGSTCRRLLYHEFDINIYVSPFTISDLR